MLGSRSSSRGAKIATRSSLTPQVEELDRHEASDEPARRVVHAVLLPVGGTDAPGSSQVGSSTSNVEPRPSSLSTRMRPFCISTRRRVIARPSPVPRLRTRSSFVCLYSSKMTARSCGLMPGPGVAHGEAGQAAVAADVHHDLALLRELDGVADQVGEHLPHALGVGAGVDAASPSTWTATGRASDEPGGLADDLPRDGREIDLRARQPELPALEGAELEDVVDEIEQVLARPEDLLDLFAGLGGERPVDLGHEDVGEAEDGVERAPQLVADGGEEGGTVAVGGADTREVVLVARLRGAEARRRAR